MYLYIKNNLKNNYYHDIKLVLNIDDKWIFINWISYYLYLNLKLLFKSK